MTVAVVLLHSPLVGPLTWRPVADRMAAAGRRVVVPDLTPALAAPPYLRGVTARAAAAVDPVEAPLVLVGHSGAGPLLPGIAQAVGARVAALVYVDALLPYPGDPWLAHAPRPLVDHLRALVRDGRLPPWHEWFPPEAVAELLPDPAQRATFVADLPRLPFGYLAEATSPARWTGPAGYLLLSDGYRDHAGNARAAGMEVVEHDGHHLAMLTAPDAVTAALDGLIARVTG